MADKKVIITLFDGDPIEIIGKSSWGSVFPDAGELNEKYKSGDKFVSVNSDGGETNTVRIENIKSVKEITLEEEEQNGKN